MRGRPQNPNQSREKTTPEENIPVRSTGIGRIE